MEIRLAARPLVLFTGILGAGKTTFLRTLLPVLNRLGIPARVVINDYHNAAVDAATLAHLTDEVTAVSGSCVCCDSRDELFDALAKAAGRTGEVLLVETNGTTDTLDLLAKFADDGRTRGLCLLQVSLVDCERWQTDHWQQELEASQLQTASHVVFSRAKRGSQRRREAVASAVRVLNGRAAGTSPKRLADPLRLLSTRRRWLIPRTLRDRRFSARRDPAEPNALQLGSRAILIGPNLDASALCRQAERAFAPEQAMPARRSARLG